VLTGDNGHGKSALLDAITWALWGRRGGPVPSDELIPLGASEMEVEFEFLLDEHQIRVIRKRSAAAEAGTPICSRRYDRRRHLQAAHRALSQRNERLIERTLRMSYRTFTNFGRSSSRVAPTASRPTRQPSASRILPRILELGYYDELEGRAKSASSRAKRNSAMSDASPKAGRRKSPVAPSNQAEARSTAACNWPASMRESRNWMSQAASPASWSRSWNRSNSRSQRRPRGCNVSWSIAPASLDVREPAVAAHASAGGRGPQRADRKSAAEWTPFRRDLELATQAAARVPALEAARVTRPADAGRGASATGRRGGPA